MLQKILVILVGLAMSLIGALSPEGLFAAQPQAGLGVDLSGAVTDETLATIRAADKAAFARVPILWAEVDGKRVVEDAWGTGEVKDLRFKVGVKGVEGTALMVGDRQVPLQPTDVLTVRMFRGDFSFRGMGTNQATLQLQGEVKTTTVSQGDSTNRLLTKAGERPADEGRPSDGRVAYVVLTTGQKMDTVALEQGGARLFTAETVEVDVERPEAGNLLVKWVKIDARLVREYTWGEGTLDSVEFELAEGAGDAVTVAYNGNPAPLRPGVRASVSDFVGEYLVYQVAGGLYRLRLDGYAASYEEGPRVPLPPATAVGSGPGAPLAAFDFSPSAPRSTDVIRFRDLSVAAEGDDIVLRRWDFGDGTADVRAEPTHRYDKPGVYEVTLEVTDLDGLTSKLKRTLTVRNAEPSAAFEFAPKRIHSGSLVTFTDLSRDADGAVVNFTWDFGDGSVSHSRHPTHRFVKGGNHTVTLTVQDDLQGVSTTARTVVVLNTAPAASFSFAPAQPASQTPVRFFDNSTDADGTVVSWEWSFGDGGKATGPTPTYSFAQPGVYTVTLVATDDAGGATTLTQPITVVNRPPRADFIWSPMGAPADKPVKFTSTSTDDDGRILLTSWDFGDGTGTGREPVVEHFFPRAGTYNVTVTVTDNFLATGSLTRSVTIANAAPRVDFTMAPVPAFRGLPVTFADASRDPDGDPIAERRWDFGDGSPSLDASAVTTHTYERLGTFPVTLHVKDDKGNAAFATRSLQVLNRPPQGAFTWEPAIPVAGQPVYLNATGLDPDGPQTLTYEWHFDDGSAKGQNVVRVFPSGRQTVTLRIYDVDQGVSAPILRILHVNVASPVAGFTYAPLVPATDEEVTFTDTSTSPNGQIVSREWFINSEGVQAGGATFKHAFPSHERAYMVSLHVRDNVGASDWFHQNITPNGRPRALFEAPVSSVPLGETVRFGDRSWDPENAVLRYRWDFGDGTPPVTQSGNVTHVYSSPGTKTVTLTVTDDKGANSTAVRSVTVANRRPVARWDVMTENPRAGLPVSFRSSGLAYDPDGPGHLREWSWNFGDGGTSSDPDPVHTFAESGIYTVNLQVSDGQLKSATETGSYRLVRVGAPHAVTVTLSAEYPDGRPVSLVDDRYELTATFGQSGTGHREIPKGTFTPNGSALDVRFEPGTWVAGDQLAVTLRDESFMEFPLEKLVTLNPDDGSSKAVKMLFEVPLPLRVSVEVDAGADYLPLVIQPFPNATQTRSQEPIYRSPVERFAGTGRVTFSDGVPVRGADVVIYARYVPLGVMATAQDAADLHNVAGLGVLGWCRAALPTSTTTGDFTWRFDSVECLSGATGVFPAGRWEIYATAAYKNAESAQAEVQRIWVDPTGGSLTLIPLP